MPQTVVPQGPFAVHPAQRPMPVAVLLVLLRLEWPPGERGVWEAGQVSVRLPTAVS
jgi:hypothetical protein